MLFCLKQKENFLLTSVFASELWYPSLTFISFIFTETILFENNIKKKEKTFWCLCCFLLLEDV